MTLANEDSKAGKQLGLLNEAFIRLVAEGRKLGDVSTQYSVDFLGEMAVGTMNAVVINWIHDPEYPIQERVKELTVFLCDVLVDD